MSSPSIENLTSQYYFWTSFFLVSASVLWTCGRITESQHTSFELHFCDTVLWLVTLTSNLEKLPNI